MRQFCAIIFIILFFSVLSTKGQVVTITNPTNTTPNLAATYTSLANAITALNSRTAISGPVTITLNSGNPQTAPVGGYAINFATITNNTFPITITGSNNTITAFTPQSSGVLVDAIFKIIGADNIIIQNFVMQENAGNINFTANTNTMTEWGVALLYKSTTDGAQNNTIQNNTISLNRNYQNSFGIYSSVAHSPTVIGTNAPITNNTTGPNSNNKVYSNNISNVNLGISFVGVATGANMDVGNDIGGSSAATGNTITNWGGATLAISGYFYHTGTIHGIFTNHQVSVNISYNTLTSATISGITTTVRGIHNRYSGGVPTGAFTTTISNNTVTLTNNNTSGTFEGILSELLANTSATVNITNNKILNNSWTTVAFTGISNTSACGVINISNNIFRGNTSSATTTGFTAINQSAAVATTITINNNSIGDGTGNAISYSTATSGALNGINCSNSGTAAAVSISNNNFQGFVQSVAGTGIHRYIFLTHAPSAAITDNINGNTFTNLTANTSGNVTFIQRSGAMALNAGATQNCNNNNIVTAFSKPVAGGVVSLYLTGSTCFSGNTFYETGNNFSNITLTGATDMGGWDNEEGGVSTDNKPAKNINTNTFKNWNCGSGAVNVIQIDFGGAGSYTLGNIIENISTSGAIEGIFYGTGTTGIQFMENNSISLLSAGGAAWGISGAGSLLMHINSNDIHSITSTGAASADGIRIASGSTAIEYNKIYDINASNVSCVANGVEIVATGPAFYFDLFTNMIGDIKAPLTSNGLAVTGVKVAATVNGNTRIYHNTIYLNAGSSGTNFGTAAVYVPGTSGTANTTLRNNIIVNVSIANGTGVTAAYRRSNTDLTTYNSASNKNIFYAGTPSSTNLIFYDGINGDQTLAAFKTRVGPTREANSFTELPPFLSVSGASAGFLHIDPTIPTQAESGATSIVVTGPDFDGDPRSNPVDIGADEFDGIYSELIPPVVGAYTTLSSPICSFANRPITGVTITDATGVPLTGANVPRIYYRKNAGTWFSQPGTNTGGTINSSTWDFTIVVADMAPVGGEVISYYIIAQDLNPIPNTASNPSAGLVATGVNAVTTHPTSPNTYVYGYNLSGTYTVGAAGNFTTLTAAVFAYNNACTLAGPTIFELLDNNYASETYPITVNYRADANSTNTLTIRPSATATPVFTYATLTPEQIINLNGARYITFDGRQGGTGTGKSLSLISTGTGVAVQFINDAQNNTIKYCNIAAHRAAQFSGTIAFLTANTGTGNDNNTIDNNEIYDATGGFSNNGIYSAGTAGSENDNNTISNNNVSNYYSATAPSYGIYVSSNSSSWTITGNRFFQTATRVYTGANVFVLGIYVTAGTGYTVSNNIIGYANAAGTGTTNMIGNSVTLAGFPSSYSVTGTATALRYAGIGLSLGLVGTPSTVDGNTIGGIAMYTSSNASTLYGMFGGIYVESGTVNIGATSGNIIGGTTGNNSIYVATTNSGGTVVGIRASCVLSSSIQNNTIGSIISSGTTSSIAGSFTGISFNGSCNFTISNNTIGSSTANNIQVGFAASGGFLTNSGTLTANIAGSSAFKGIVSTSTGSTLTLTNNILRGWNTSCTTTAFNGIQTSGAMFGSAGVVNINNNFFGAGAINWINNANNNTGLIYGMDLGNSGVLTLNIKNNDFVGNIFGTTSGAGGGLIRLLGSTAANNITTISGNTFTNLSVFFSGASRYLYCIYTAYALLSTGQLIIDNNQIVGTFNSTGATDLHMINCSLTAAAGSKLNITNNNFSNLTAATGFTTNLEGFYSGMSNGSGIVTVTGNTINNWSSGTGGITGIDISDMSGTATCSNNNISTIASQGDFEGISMNTSSTSGSFNITNNSISGVTSSGAGGYVYGISEYVPAVSNTAQINIANNNIHSFSTTSSIPIITGIYLESGHATSTLTANSNKIYDLSGSSSGCRVFGIYNHTTLKGNFTYTNNYIGDLRAPNSTAGQAVTGIKLYLVSGLAKAYYNTIYLNAAASVAQFSSAGVYADGATAVTLRNNIFINISSHGASGRTVAYWRGDTNLGTYDALSNNNLFYAGTPSARDVIFYDGTNSDQTLAAYQTRVSTRDNLSVSALPNFISTTGSNANFLHIAATGNCAVNARGNNSGILLTTDYDNDSRSTVAPFVTDIGADEFSRKNAWTGANGTNWNDTGNWSEGIVPNADDDNVIIANPPVNQPVIASGDVYQVASVIIGTGATLTNKGILKIAGSVYAANAASFNNTPTAIVEGSVEMNGACGTIVQLLAGNVFAGNAVKDFKVSNNVTISSVAGEHVNVSGELGFGAVSSKTLITGDNITLVSTFNGTANVGKIINGNIISGKASVERYINTGTGGGQHGKGWQFLATPAKGQTISQAWQENVSPTVGYGTIITGTGSGFDFTTTLPSMKSYDPTIGTNGDWVGVSTTGAQIDEKRGYMIFVRGDRTVTAYNAPATPTRLRIKGNLFQPNDPPPVTNVLANKWVSVGNPYASSVDLTYMKNNGLFVNTNNDVVVWDPLLYGTYGYGGYQTLAAANNYEPTAGGTSYYAAGTASPYIQSGQAFFIHSSGAAGTVTFTEAAKHDTDRLVNKVAPINNRQYFRAGLFTNTGIVADGNAVAFENVYSNAVDKDDATKMANSGENFGITRAGKNLSVEARKLVTITDTIYYTLSNLRKQTYQFRFAPKNMQGSGLNAYLIDRYLQTTTQLSISDSSFVNIDITNDPPSYAADRFYVVFKKRLLSAPIQTATPVSEFAKGNTVQKPETESNNNNGTSISIYPNPVENKTIQLHFAQQETGMYRIQLMNNLGQPVYNGNIVINNPVSTNLIKIDAGIAAGNYLLNVYAENGVKTVLRVVIK